MNAIDLAEYKYAMGERLYKSIDEATEETQELIDYVESILKEDIHVNYKNIHSGHTSLMLSIEKDFQTIFNILMEYNPKLEIADGEGISAIHLASVSTNPHYLVSLCDHDAYLDAQDTHGNRPINYAINARLVQNIGELLSRNCTTNHLNAYGHSIYDDALTTGNENVIESVFNYDKKKKKGIRGKIKSLINFDFKK